MVETLVPFSWNVFDPDNTAALGASGIYFKMPFSATLVYVSVSPFEDDTGATIDIQVDTADIVTAIGAADHDVPGEWVSTHFGGTQTPVFIAADSDVEVDFNAAAAGNRFDITMWFAASSIWA